MLKCYIFIPRK